MKAVFKHELRAYLHSPVSYAAGGLFLLVSAVYYTIDNIRGHNGDLGALYAAMGTLFLFIIPILTSRVIAEERRNGMETLLFTSPTGIADIVAGKFFAVFSLIGGMIALTLVFPLILLLFTPLHPLSLLGNYMGLLLLGAFVAALGIFASALTESQVTAAIIGFVSLLFLLILRPAASLLGGTGAKILSFASPYARFDAFGRGIVRFGDILYFFGFTFLFLFFTTALLTARRNRGLTGGQLWGRLSAVSVTAIVLVLNLFAQRYPISFDFSEGKRYSISEATFEALAELPRDVTVYALFDEGKADRDYLEVCELLAAYERAAKGRVRVEYRDPDIDTRIVSALDPDGSLGLRKNNFYVTDGARGKKLVYEDLFELRYDGKTSAWFVTGSAAERAFTDAILSAGGEKPDTVYLVADAPDAYGTLEAAIEKAGYRAQALDYARNGIPDNAAALLFLAPEYDLTEAERAALGEWLKGGGSAGVFSEAGAFSNWNALLREYGISFTADSYTELLLDVPAGELVPLEFFGLYLPSARALEAADENAEILVAAADGAPLSVAAESGGKLFAVGSAEYISDATKAANAASFVTNLYFTESALDWLLAKGGEEASIRAYQTGELQIPVYKANFIGLLTVLVLPLAIFGRGFVVWRKRRYL